MLPSERDQAIDRTIGDLHELTASLDALDRRVRRIVAAREGAPPRIKREEDGQEDDEDTHPAVLPMQFPHDPRDFRADIMYLLRRAEP